MNLRLFVAIELNEAVQAMALRTIESLQAAGVIGRFEAPEKLHITVAFLGSVPEEKLDEIVAALRETSAGCRPSAVEFTRLGAFPNLRRPRILWIGPSKADELEACMTRVRAGLGGLGFTFDHDPSPHITICRPKKIPRRRLPLIADRAMQTVAGLTLFRSIPAGSTTRYEALERTTFPPS